MSKSDPDGKKIPDESQRYRLVLHRGYKVYFFSIATKEQWS